MQIRPLHSSWEDACKELWGFGFSNQTTFSVNSDRSLWDICSFQSLHGCDGIHTACVLSCWGTLIELEYSCIFLWHLCRFFFLSYNLLPVKVNVSVWSSFYFVSCEMIFDLVICTIQVRATYVPQTHGCRTLSRSVQKLLLNDIRERKRH